MYLYKESTRFEIYSKRKLFIDVINKTVRTFALIIINNLYLIFKYYT